MIFSPKYWKQTPYGYRHPMATDTLWVAWKGEPWGGGWKFIKSAVIRHNIVLIFCGHFYAECSQPTPHGSPARASHGVKVVNWMTDFCFTIFKTCCMHYRTILEHIICIVRCCYNAVNFIKSINKKRPIPRLLGQGIGCPLCIQPLIDILPQFL